MQMHTPFNAFPLKLSTRSSYNSQQGTCSSSNTTFSDGTCCGSGIHCNNTKDVHSTLTTKHIKDALSHNCTVGTHCIPHSDSFSLARLALHLCLPVSPEFGRPLNGGHTTYVRSTSSSSAGFPEYRSDSSLSTSTYASYGQRDPGLVVDTGTQLQQVETVRHTIYTPRKLVQVNT